VDDRARDELLELLRSRIARARADRHRALWVAPDALDDAALDRMLRTLELTDVAWLGPDAEGRAGRLGLREARRLLGAERDAIVLDLRRRFDPDALGLAHGAVRAGGALVLRLRRDAPSRLEARVARLLSASDDAPVAEGWPEKPAPAHETADQARAVEALVAMLGAARPAPVVLVADRGRGKSAALGLAAAQALARGLDVRVVAPRREAIETLERFARDDAGLAQRRLRYVGARVDRALDPDALWLVDEAAALPLEVLRALARAPRVAFATTVHGYEGTGRGFTERFLRVLAETREARVLTLREPVRFAAGDPLERMVFELLLLDAAPAPDDAVCDAHADEVTHEVVERDRLARDEGDLRAVFGLLVAAHYRTTPRDLASLLDGADNEVHVLRWRGHAVAAALLAREGGLDEPTLEALRRGGARPTGHALPETMIAHGRAFEAASLRGLRVVRLAVHPALQRRGLGARLLDAVVAEARARELDWVGALFGVAPPLLAFWEGRGFVPVRLSVARGTSTGEHSAAVLRACSSGAEATLARLRAAFVEDLPAQLADPLRELEPDLALAALRGAPVREPRLTDRELEQLAASAFGALPYGVALRATHELVASAVHAPTPGLDDVGRRALVLKVLQHRAWGDVADALGVDGVPNAMRAVRSALRPLLRAHGGERAARWIATFE
jgi:tRNA(Met) cytidine acetyltransferase